MNKKVVVSKTPHKEKTLEDQIDSLARIVVSGFERMDKKFEQVDSRLDIIDSRLDTIDSRLDTMDSHLTQLDSSVSSINHELKDHSIRLERIEKRQMGTLLTLDETVHRSEFKTLTKRVEALERKK